MQPYARPRNLACTMKRLKKAKWVRSLASSLPQTASSDMLKSGAYLAGDGSPSPVYW